MHALVKGNEFGAKQQQKRNKLRGELYLKINHKYIGMGR